VRVVEPRGPPPGRRRARPRRTGRASAGASGPGAADARRAVPSAPRRARSSSPGEIQADPAFRRGQPPLFPPGRLGLRVPGRGYRAALARATARAPPAGRPRPRPPDRPSGPVRRTAPLLELAEVDPDGRHPQVASGNVRGGSPSPRISAIRAVVTTSPACRARSASSNRSRRRPSCFGASPTRTSTGPTGRISTGCRYRAGYRPQQGTVRCSAVRRSVQDRVSAGLQARPRQACPLPGQGGTSRGAVMTGRIRRRAAVAAAALAASAVSRSCREPPPRRARSPRAPAPGAARRTWPGSCAGRATSTTRCGARTTCTTDSVRWAHPRWTGPGSAGTAV
jgi:hypothetical protein